jgi:hypothetical protein
MLPHGADGLTSSQKEFVQRISILPKSSLSSAGFEHTSLGPTSGKDDNHCLTEGD